MRRPTAGCRCSETTPVSWSRRRSRQDDLDPAALKEQLADAEQRFADAEDGSGAQGRAAKDRDRAEAFLAISQG